MKAHEILHEIFQDHCVKGIAGQIGMQPRSVNKWAETCDPAAVSPVERTGQLLDCLTGDDRLIQYLCRRAGGYYVPNPRVKAHAPEPLLEAHSRVVHEFAELIALVCEASGDNVITAAEAKRIRRHWEQSKTRTEDFVQCCERGNFKALQAALLRQVPARLPTRLAPPERGQPSA